MLSLALCRITVAESLSRVTDWRHAHPELAAREDDADIQAMAAACGMDVESFLLEQLAAGFDAAEQHGSQRDDGKQPDPPLLQSGRPAAPVAASGPKRAVALRPGPAKQPSPGAKASKQRPSKLSARAEVSSEEGTPVTAKLKDAKPAARGSGSTARGRGKKEPVPTLPEIAAGFHLLQPDGGKHLRTSSVIQVRKLAAICCCHVIA